MTTQALINLVVGVLTAGGLIVVAVAAYRKYGPEVRRIEVTIAGELRDDAMEDRKEARSDLRTLRAEFEQYKADTDNRLAEMSVQVRAARAGEVEALRKADLYMDRLTKAERRVTELETEVATLKANGAGA